MRPRLPRSAILTVQQATEILTANGISVALLPPNRNSYSCGTFDRYANTATYALTHPDPGDSRITVVTTNNLRYWAEQLKSGKAIVPRLSWFQPVNS